MTDAQPNAHQASLWNDFSGPAWVEMNAILDNVLAPFEAKLTADAFPGEGKRVLDIGCGAGATTLGMAKRLGPEGRCLGVDISAPLVAAATARAQAEGATNAAFQVADAQVHSFLPGAFDAVISRMGVMFFDDPPAAFANIRRAAAPGARLSFIAWRSTAENPFFTTAGRALAPLLPDLAPPVPGAPGQFAFADPDRVRSILAAGGWEDVDLQPLDVPSQIPETDLVRYLTRLGPVGTALEKADEATRARAGEIITEAFAPYVSDGAARFTSCCWWVTAAA